MTHKQKIAAIQLISSSNLKKNLSTAAELIGKAASQDAKLIVLPENFSCMAKTDAEKLALQEVIGEGPIQEFMSQQAKTHGVWLLGGTAPITADTADKVRAASLVYNDHGELVARYDKIHLFDVAISEHEAHQESSYVEPGDQVVCVDTPVGKLGLSVCYDLRFPELYRRLAEAGAEIFAVPSAFTYTTGKAHWEILLRARAIENLCYVVAANQGGEHEIGRITYGHSMIIEPWGKILSSCEAGEGIALAEVDLESLRQRRKSFPVHEHRTM